MHGHGSLAAQLGPFARNKSANALRKPKRAVAPHGTRGEAHASKRPSGRLAVVKADAVHLVGASILTTALAERRDAARELAGQELIREPARDASGLGEGVSLSYIVGA